MLSHKQKLVRVQECYKERMCRQLGKSSNVKCDGELAYVGNT